ncbi:MAG: energy transducer TonB [Terriglobales bacterium]|jgi:periplasmic protein TonB
MHGSARTLAVKKWRYRPFLLNGEPVEVETTSTVNFRIH